MPPRSGRGSSFFRFLLRAAFLAHLSVAVLWAQGQVGGVVAGRVTDPRGQPERLLVRLVSAGEVLVGQVYTDSNGLFVFGDLPGGVYYVSVEAPGYRPVRQAVVIDLPRSIQTQINISLESINTTATPPGQIISGSSTSYKLSLSKNRRPFDPKVLREFDKGNRKQQEGNLQAALSHYQRALRIAPDFYPALNNLGAVFLRQKDHGQAAAAFVKALELNPDEGGAYINLGHVLYEEAKYPQAIERLEEGLKRSPQSPVGHFFLGSAYLKLGDLEKAAPNLKEAYTLDPGGMASARLQLANLYLRRRDLDAASAELESYLQGNPSDPQAPAIKKMLANIKAHRAN